MIIACEFKAWQDVIECRRDLMDSDLTVRLYAITVDDDGDREPKFFVDFVTDEESLDDVKHTIKYHRGIIGEQREPI